LVGGIWLFDSLTHLGSGCQTGSFHISPVSLRDGPFADVSQGVVLGVLLQLAFVLVDRILYAGLDLLGLSV
jgi:hypothetical protein